MAKFLYLTEHETNNLLVSAGFAPQYPTHGIVQQGDNDFLAIHARSDREELEEYLDRVVATYEARKYAVLRIPSPPTHPYKSLYPFGLEDESIFFGRNVATKELYNIVLRDRLTMLYAKSGAGKTSLLNASLSPYLIRQAGRQANEDLKRHDLDVVISLKIIQERF